jgi:hypothetical protein
MGFWNRNSSDPLLDSLLKKYHLNLLSVPRENALVGDLYMQENNSNVVSTPGNIINFLTPKFEIPVVKQNEQMADVSGQVSKDISGKAGFDFLEGFLEKLGAAGIGAKIRGAYEGSKNNKILFGYPNPKRDSVDPFEFGTKLMGHSFITDHPLYAEGRRYYVVTGVAKTNSLSIELQGDEKQALDLNANIAEIGNASGGFKLENNQTGKITYTGDKNLVFGVELYELKYPKDGQKFSMSPTENAKLLRGRPGDEPAFIGDPDDGDAFISITS